MPFGDDTAVVTVSDRPVKAKIAALSHSSKVPPPKKRLEVSAWHVFDATNPIVNGRYIEVILGTDSSWATSPVRCA